MANFTQRPKSRRSADYNSVRAAAAERSRETEAPDSDFSGDEERPARKRVKKQKPEDDDVKPRRRESLPKRILHAIFPAKGDPPSEAVRKIIFDVAVIALIITGGSVLHDVLDETKQITIVEKEIQQIYIDGAVKLDDKQIETIKKEKPNIIDEFMGLYEQNPDIVGWIQIGDFISYPVMQSEDNDYYLDHNFKRETTKSGSIFADYRNRFLPGEISGNTILYGHNVWSGSMFARLSRYYDATLHGEYKDRLDFYKEYPVLTFNTLYEKSEWKVFACGLFNNREDHGEVYPYTQTQEFSNKDEFNSYVLDLMDRSAFWTDVDLTYGDSILTLSTCYQYSPYTADDDIRCAVFARKLRPGESAEVDVSKVQLNPNPLKFSHQKKVEGGGEWTGRIWDTSKLLSYEKY